MCVCVCVCGHLSVYTYKRVSVDICLYVCACVSECVWTSACVPVAAEWRWGGGAGGSLASLMGAKVGLSPPN